MFGDLGELDALIADLDKAGRAVAGRESLVVRASALRVEAAAKDLAPVDTGHLRESIGVDYPGPLDAEIGPTASYGWMVEGGTVPHIIRPKTAKALHWVGPGGSVFAAVVHHPGTAPQPYMAPAADLVVPQFEEATGAVGEKLLAGDG